MANLRILALLEATSISGTAKAVLEMAYEARANANGQKGIDLVVANFARGEEKFENSLTHELNRSQIVYSFIRERSRFDPNVLSQIRELIRRYDTQVIWTNSVKSHFLVNQSGIPKSSKWAAFHHGYTATDLKMRIYNQLDRISLRHADRVLTVCKPFAEQMVCRGVNSSRIRVQHMPIRPFTLTPEDSASLRQEFGLDPEYKVILSVGRLSREKAHIDLIQAFARLRDESQDSKLLLVIVGDGPEREALKQQAANFNCREQIVFAGHRDDVKRFYGIAAAFALPSHTEGTPNVLLEAMAAGVPIVATAVGGIPELVSDRKNALLVPSAKPLEMADALRKLITSEDLRNDLVNRAREVVVAHSPDSYFASMRDIFFEMAAE